VRPNRDINPLTNFENDGDDNFGNVGIPLQLYNNKDLTNLNSNEKLEVIYCYLLWKTMLFKQDKPLK